MKAASIAFAIAFISTHCAWAQTIYKCGNTYSDAPCTNATQVDILPTDGAHSISGTRRTSHDAFQRQFDRDLEKTFGIEEGKIARERYKAQKRERDRQTNAPSSKIQWAK